MIAVALRMTLLVGITVRLRLSGGQLFGLLFVRECLPLLIATIAAKADRLALPLNRAAFFRHFSAHDWTVLVDGGNNRGRVFAPIGRIRGSVLSAPDDR